MLGPRQANACWPEWQVRLNPGIYTAVSKRCDHVLDAEFGADCCCTCGLCQWQAAQSSEPHLASEDRRRHSRDRLADSGPLHSLDVLVGFTALDGCPEWAGVVVVTSKSAAKVRRFQHCRCRCVSSGLFGGLPHPCPGTPDKPVEFAGQYGAELPELQEQQFATGSLEIRASEPLASCIAAASGVREFTVCGSVPASSKRPPRYVQLLMFGFFFGNKDLNAKRQRLKDPLHAVQQGFHLGGDVRPGMPKLRRHATTRAQSEHENPRACQRDLGICPTAVPSRTVCLHPSKNPLVSCARVIAS